MGKKKFGLHVKRLREQKTSYFSNLTQAKLAELANIDQSQIARIEQGKMKNLERFLEPLSIAFHLNELQRAEFYALAGYNYVSSTNIVDLEKIYEFISQCPFAASIRNPVWDFLAFNAYHAALWGYTKHTLNLLNQSIGANLLRVFFDEEIFKDQTLTASQRDLPNAIAEFKTSSFRYITTSRYDEIVKYMIGNYPTFEQIWWLVEREPTFEKQRNSFIKTITHDELGQIEFLSLKMPSTYVGSFYSVSVYIPISNEKYMNLRRLVEKNIEESGIRLHQFTEHELV